MARDYFKPSDMTECDHFVFCDDKPFKPNKPPHHDHAHHHCVCGKCEPLPWHGCNGNHHIIEGWHDKGCHCGNVDPDEAFMAYLARLEDGLKDMFELGHYPCHDAVGKNYECLVRPSKISWLLDVFYAVMHEREWLALQCAKKAYDNEIGMVVGHNLTNPKDWMQAAKQHTRTHHRPKRHVRMYRTPKFPNTSNIHGCIHDTDN